MHLHPAHCCQPFVENNGQPYTLTLGLMAATAAPSIRMYLEDEKIINDLLVEAGACTHVVEVAMIAFCFFKGNKQHTDLVAAAEISPDFTISDLLKLEDLESNMPAPV